jgi:hypothetical protein
MDENTKMYTSKLEIIDYITVQLNKLGVVGVDNMNTVVSAVKMLLTLREILKSEEAESSQTTNQEGMIQNGTN